MPESLSQEKGSLYSERKLNARGGTSEPPLEAMLSTAVLNFQPKRDADTTNADVICVLRGVHGPHALTWRFRPRNGEIGQARWAGRHLVKIFYFPWFLNPSSLLDSLFDYDLASRGNSPYHHLHTLHHQDFHLFIFYSLCWVSMCIIPPTVLRESYYNHLDFIDEKTGTEKWSNLPQLTLTE